jgi:hypothetical protein
MADDALRAVLRLRFLKFLFRASSRPPRRVADTESIADVTGFAGADAVDADVRRRVNSNDIGMGDVLALALEPGTLGADTTIARAVGVILDHAAVSTHEEYEGRLRERVDVMLEMLLAEREDQPPGKRPPFAAMLQKRFERFLLLPVDGVDETMTADEITDALVRLMVLQ